MFKYVVKIVLSLVAMYNMFHFSYPKLLGYDVSVKTFTHFGEVLGISGSMFMHFVGVLEGLIVVLLAVSILPSKKISEKIILQTGVLGNVLLLGTMAGALVAEFFLRPAPVDKLVTLASALIAVAIVQLIFISSPRDLLKKK